MDRGHPFPPPIEVDQDRLGRMFDALKKADRRRLLYLLCETDSLSVDEAAKRIAGQKHGTDPNDLSKPGYEDELVSLYHTHLPRLEELGIVDYDDRSGAIRLYDRSEELHTILELTRSIDGFPSRR